MSEQQVVDPDAPDAGDIGLSVGIDRALRIVFAAATATGPDVGVTELARATGLSKAVVHRVLRTLVGRQFFAFDPETHRYRFGPGALIVGMAALGKQDVLRVAEPHLHDLVARTEETATLSALVGLQRVYVRQVISPQEIHMAITIGSVVPLVVGGSSLSILAALPEPTVGQVAADARVPLERLEPRIAEVRERGYAATRGERLPDAASVSTAIRGADGLVFGSISACGPIERFDEARIADLGPIVATTALAISRDLGFSESAIYG